MSITAVLCLPAISQSLSYRVFEERLMGMPLLTWWALEASAMPGINQAVVLVRSGGDECRVRRHLNHTPAKLFTCKQSSFTRCLAAFVEDSGVQRIAVVQLALPIGPKRLLDRTLAHHQSMSNELTEIVGLPHGVCAVIFEAKPLAILGALRAPNVPSDPLRLYRRIRGAGAEALAALGLAGASIPFDGAAAYTRPGSQLPFAVHILTNDDVETCRRVLARVRPSLEDNTSALEAWREEQYRDRIPLVRSRAESACAHVVPRDDRPRILFVSNPSATTGAEHSLLQMIKFIDPRRFDRCALVAVEGFFTKELMRRGVTVICPNADFARQSADDYLFMKTVLNNINPSLIHLNALSGDAVMAAATDRRTPIVLHTRNRPDRQYLDAFSYSSAIISVSKYIQMEIMRFGIPEGRVRMIYNGVDTKDFCRALFDRDMIRTSLGLNSDAKIILMLARMTPNKRHDLMISALPLIKRTVPTACVVALGESLGEEEYLQELMDMIDGFDLGDCFTLRPFQEDVRPYFVAADAFVLCSDGEPLARTVIESLAMETPIVITNSGGTPEIIQHGKTGLVAKAGNVESLAECVIATLTDSQGSRERTRAGRVFAEKHLSSQRTAENVMQLYHSLIRDGS